MPTQDAKLCVLVIRAIHGDETKNLSANVTTQVNCERTHTLQPKLG